MYSVLPNVQKASYQGGDLVTFDISADMAKALVPGSLRLTGSLTVGIIGDPPTQINAGTQVYMNPLIGVHGAIDQISTTSSTKGTLENITDYGRAVITMRQAKFGQVEATSTAVASLELCMPDAYSTQPLFRGHDANTLANDFCISPRICVNSSATSVPFSRLGTISIAMILAQPSRFLHGANAPLCTYLLSNLQLTYLATQATKDMNQPIVMAKTECVRRQLATGSTSFQTNASLIASKLLGTFVLQSTLSDPTLDHYRSINLDIEQLGFTYNNSDELVSFLQEGQNEIIANFLFASQERSVFRSALATSQGINAVTTSPVQGGYGVGACFSPAVDMSRNQLGVTINGAVVPSTVIAYFVFQGAIVV